jgi:hypothetical protein
MPLINNSNPEHLSSTITATIQRITALIGAETESRAYRASNELTNAIGFILRGQRSGRVYNVPGTGRVKYNKRTKTATITYRKYTASAPGEAPANRTGIFRLSWRRRNYVTNRNGNDRVIHAVTESDYRVKSKSGGSSYLLGEILENGLGRIEKRPFKQRTIDRAMPAVIRIYREPYGG